MHLCIYAASRLREANEFRVIVESLAYSVHTNRANKRRSTELSVRFLSPFGSFWIRANRNRFTRKSHPGTRQIFQAVAEVRWMSVSFVHKANYWNPAVVLHRASYVYETYYVLRQDEASFRYSASRLCTCYLLRAQEPINSQSVCRRQGSEHFWSTLKLRQGRSCRKDRSLLRVSLSAYCDSSK